VYTVWKVHIKRKCAISRQSDSNVEEVEGRNKNWEWIIELDVAYASIDKVSLSF
jgi:hypothetical protein